LGLESNWAPSGVKYSYRTGRKRGRTSRRVSVARGGPLRCFLGGEGNEGLRRGVEANDFLRLDGSGPGGPSKSNKCAFPATDGFYRGRGRPRVGRKDNFVGGGVSLCGPKGPWRGASKRRKFLLELAKGCPKSLRVGSRRFKIIRRGEVGVVFLGGGRSEFCRRGRERPGPVCGAKELGLKGGRDSSFWWGGKPRG